MGNNFSFDQIPSVHNQTVVITGGAAGIGYVCARELARKGWHVVIAARTPSAAEHAIENLKRESGSSKFDFIQLDLSSMKSIKAFSDEYHHRGFPLHVLLNNAGVMGCPRSFTEDGFEMQFGTNHIGHYLLTRLLLDVIQKTATAEVPARVVNLASVGHLWCPRGGIEFDNLKAEKSYSPWTAYGQSKLANILFTKELARQVEGQNILVNAVHPGYVKTTLARHVETVHGHIASVLGNAAASIFAKTPDQGALTSLYAVASPDITTNKLTGQYFVPTAKLSAPSAYAQDPELAKKLWQVSEELVKEYLPHH
eukprot:GILK01002226.1.p1 GENE.GILK01002226.1~~GILK01002226.1.p1  ORF type:complete len:311 (-),score=44.40 GILK01002226.1:154-1086(-)